MPACLACERADGEGGGLGGEEQRLRIGDVPSWCWPRPGRSLSPSSVRAASARAVSLRTTSAWSAATSRVSLISSRTLKSSSFADASLRLFETNFSASGQVELPGTGADGLQLLQAIVHEALRRPTATSRSGSPSKSGPDVVAVDRLGGQRRAGEPRERRQQVHRRDRVRPDAGRRGYCPGQRITQGMRMAPSDGVVAEALVQAHCCLAADCAARRRCRRSR